MKDIELVIKIPEEDFERCKKRFQMRIDIMGDAIANGKPLPQGHGRLVDADMLLDLYHDNDYDFYEALDDVQTIIEADKEDKECMKAR